ncbi:MAG: adenylate/guanylate cyclase domain-containing protein [Myxococcales bacterium]
MAKPGDDPWGVLLRLSTYAPAHAVMAAARGEIPGPGRSTLDGAVLVADLSGFTALSELLGRMGRDGIDELTGILNQVFSTLLERAVFPWGGALVKYAGDALLCYFEGEDSAPRSVAAGLAAQASMEALSEKLGRRLAVRVGIGAGRFDLVTVGRLGERLDCFCAGEAAMRALVAVDDAPPRSLILEGPGLPRGPFHAGSDLAERLAGHRLTPHARPNSLAGVERFDVRVAVERLRPFVPPEVFERIGENPNAPLRAERRDACAVFCEVEGWDGDVNALGDHYRTAWECARRHGGMLNKNRRPAPRPAPARGLRRGRREGRRPAPGPGLRRRAARPPAGPRAGGPGGRSALRGRGRLDAQARVHGDGRHGQRRRPPRPRRRPRTESCAAPTCGAAWTRSSAGPPRRCRSRARACR